MKQKKYTFQEVIQTSPKFKNSAYVNFPFSTQTEFGKKGQVKIQVLFDQNVEYRGSLAKMGGPHHILILRKDIRAALGKDIGDLVEVQLWEDLEPRIVEVPNYVRKRIEEKPSRATFYDQLSYTHQKEYIHWVTGAKKEETRERRLDKMMEMLDQNIKHP